MTFLHALRCIQVFGEKPKFAKIYGSYFHSIVKHLPEHARIISPSSLYTESEERIFNALRGIGRDARSFSRGFESEKQFAHAPKLCFDFV